MLPSDFDCMAQRRQVRRVLLQERTDTFVVLAAITCCTNDAIVTPSAATSESAPILTSSLKRTYATPLQIRRMKPTKIALHIELLD